MPITSRYTNKCFNPHPHFPTTEPGGPEGGASPRGVAPTNQRAPFGEEGRAGGGSLRVDPRGCWPWRSSSCGSADHCRSLLRGSFSFQ